MSHVEALAATVERFDARRVWLVGDLMLDEYLRGRVERISPEAPVPVVAVTDRECRPGGAANVARQLARFGAHVHLAGVVGDDDAGRELLAHCGTAGIDAAPVAKVPGRCTTKKVRVLGHGHQMVRLDWEESSAPPGSRPPWSSSSATTPRASSPPTSSGR